MFKKLAEAIRHFFQEETLAERSKRIVPGVVYGALAAVLYIIVSSVINVIFYKNLHLGVNWVDVLFRCVSFGAALALAGVIVGWFTENYEGIVFGGMVLAALILLGNLASSALTGRSSSLMGQSILITIIPLVGACILLAGVIRMAIIRRERIRQVKEAGPRRNQLIQLTCIVILVGVILGGFSFYGTPSTDTLQALNSSLQNYQTDPLIEKRFPYDNLPNLKAHFGMDYYLYARTSSQAPDTMEITIHFTDGYSVTCLVPRISSNESLLLDTCNEGNSVKLP